MSAPVATSGTFALGGDLEVRRLGFGAMRILGKGVWGPPPDVEVAREVVREAVRLGVTLIDTAEAYGPELSETIIAEALYPYPEDVVVATKGGFDRSGPGRWEMNGRPERLRECVEGSLQRLRVDRIDLWQLHRIDPKVPLEEQLGTIQELQDEGKIRHVGLSEVSVEELERCRETLEIVSVQNRFNYADRGAEDVLEHCEAAGIGFIPWFPLATGDLAAEGSPLAEAAQRHDVSPSQLALAWLLARSDVMLPIPGTGSVEHVRENCAAAEVQLAPEEIAAL
jgi:aryl-alcohol dehydrogenase-like predicted oxidoreductase